MKKSLSLRIKNAASSIAVENLKAQHTYLHCITPGNKEFGVIWTQREDTSWGHGDGRMYGIENVKMYHVNHFDYKAYKNYIGLLREYPQVGGLDPHPLLECPVHTLATDIVEVASDGMSARSSHLTPGVLISWLNPDGKRFGAGLWERYGTDYLYEDGQWLIHHDQVCPDSMFMLDRSSNWAAISYKRLRSGEHKPEPDSGRWGRNHPGWVHRMYSPVQLPQDTVSYPEPYDSFDFEDNYSTIPCVPC